MSRTVSDGSPQGSPQGSPHEPGQEGLPDPVVASRETPAASAATEAAQPPAAPEADTDEAAEPEQLAELEQPAEPEQPKGRHRQPRKLRMRGFLRRPTVRVIGVLLAAFLLWVSFSVGQALAAPGGGSLSSKLAEWARDHYLGPDPSRPTLGQNGHPARNR